MVRKPPMYLSPDVETASSPAPAPAPTPVPAVTPPASGKVVKIVMSAATSFGAINPGEVIHCEDVEDAAQLIRAGIAKATDEEPSRKMPSTAALAAKEAKARERSGDDVPVLQGFDPDIHEKNVETARNQRAQEDKASKPPARSRKPK